MDNTKIFKNGIRILTPQQFKAIYDAIDKHEYKDKLEAQLLTGMRYNELQRLYKHKDDFNGQSIYVKSGKGKARQKERHVQLNKQGIRAVEYFLRSKKNLPSRESWNENLKRWCKKIGLDDEGITTKCFRKTWESWLGIKYPSNWGLIFLSQGHTDKTAMEYYMMCPFNDEHNQGMDYYTEGWMSKL